MARNYKQRAPVWTPADEQEAGALYVAGRSARQIAISHPHLGAPGTILRHLRKLGHAIRTEGWARPLKVRKKKAPAPKPAPSDRKARRELLETSIVNALKTGPKSRGELHAMVAPDIKLDVFRTSLRHLLKANRITWLANAVYIYGGSYNTGWGPERKLLLVKLWEQGLKHSEIATRLNSTKGNVQQMARNYYLPPRAQVKSRRNPEYRRLVKILSDGAWHRRGDILALTVNVALLRNAIHILTHQGKLERQLEPGSRKRLLYRLRLEPNKDADDKDADAAHPGSVQSCITNDVSAPE